VAAKLLDRADGLVQSGASLAGLAESAIDSGRDPLRLPLDARLLDLF
jgi:hypothetical protein